MKKLSLLILTLILISCGQKIKRDKNSFSDIEITYDNGWTGGLTVHIDSSGIIKKCEYHIISEIDSAICFIDTLDFSILDTLNAKIKKLKNATIDSLYDGHCQDCGGFIIKIKYDNRTVRTMIIGHDKFDNSISSFARYVTDLKIDRNSLDSIIIFETTKFLIPPQIGQEVKFLSPRDEETKKMLVGFWAENENENSLFYLDGHFIHYTEGNGSLITYTVKGDSLLINGNPLARCKIIKLSKDSLWFTDEYNADTTRLFKRD
jgi:hypothetical protein